MDLRLIIQSVIFGVFVGALYGLAAVGFSFVFGVMRILNIAHGMLIMLGGYATFILFSRFGIDPFLALPFVALALFLVGGFLYKILFSHVVKFEEELRTNVSLLISFGLILILEQGSTLTFTADERSVTPFYSGESLEILGIHLPLIRLGILLVSVLITLSLQIFLNRTYFGKAIRAAAESLESATLMGININRTYWLSFALACALAGAAGAMVIVGYSINPTMGLEWILKAMIVAIIAGMGSIGGAFVAGVFLGIVEAVSGIFLGPYMQAVGLVIFLFVLMFRPQGLFSKRGALL
jgi:branched-chain amino acid transport system permease protein